jgi:serine O-acetyltransferase
MPNDDVADALLEAYLAPANSMFHIGSYELPSREQIGVALEQCRALLFPGYAGPSVARLPRTEVREYVRERLDEVRNGLRRQVYRALHHKKQLANNTSDNDCPDCAAEAEAITNRFVARLPALREAVALDVAAAYDGDPAATGIDEVLFCYPGTYAISVYRIANALLREGGVLIPRIMTELAHERTGIDIHPGATVGRSFFIDHGTGVVIGETSVIGDRVRLYQGVTLGAVSVPHRADLPTSGKRHPTLEDDVVIYAGATILGGDTVIGAGAVIGGNAWVTASVAPGARVAGTVNRR